MADRNLELALRIKAAIDGLGELQKLAGEIEGLGGNADEVKRQASALAAELERLTRQQNLVDLYQRTEAQLGKTSDALETARAKQRAFTDQVIASEEPSRRLQDQHRAATDTVGRLEAQLAKERAELEQLGRNMQYAGLETSNLGRQSNELAGRISAANTQVKELTDSTRQTRDALTQKGEKVGLLSRLLGTFRGDTAQAASQTGLFGSAVGKLTGLLGGMAAGFVGLRQAGRVLVDIVQTGSQFERFQKQLEGAFGSAEKGQAAFEWVKSFARNTPLELQDTLDAVVKLKSFGLDPLDGTLQALVDQNERLGGGQERLNGLVLAVGQAWAKQKLQGEEVLQLVERGVPVYDLLQKALGKTAAEIQDMQQKGLLGRDAIRALIEEIGRSTQGAALDQMRTFNGTVSNLKDNYTQFLAQIADAGVLDVFKREIADVSAGLAESGETAVRVAAGIRLAFETLVFVAGTVRSAWNAVTSVVKLGMATVSEAAALYAQVMSKITFGDLSKGFSEAADSLQIRARELRESAKGDLDDISAAGDQMGRSLKGAGDAAVQLFDDVPSKAKAAAGALDNTAASAGDLAAAANSAATALEERLAGGATNAAGALGAVETRSGAAAKAIEELIGNIKAISAQELIDVAAALRQVEANGKASGEAIEKGLVAGVKKLSDTELPQLLATARDVLGTINQDTADGAARFEQMSGIVDTLRTEAFARLGVDTQTVLTGIDEKARALLTTFQSLVSDPKADPKLLTAAFQELFKTLDSPQELEALKASLKGVQIQGFDTAGAIAEIDKQLKVVGDSGTEAGRKVKEAFAAFGIQTRDELEVTAQTVKEQFQLIQSSGQATASGLDDAFSKMAEAQLAAAGGLGKAAQEAKIGFLAATAATDKQREAIVELIKKYELHGDTARRVLLELKNQLADVNKELEKEKTAIDAVEAAYQRRQQARRDAVENDPTNPRSPNYDPRAITPSTDGGTANAAGIDERYGQLNADQRAEVDALFEEKIENVLRAQRTGNAGKINLAVALLQSDIKSLISGLLNGTADIKPGRTVDITINLPGYGSARVSATPDQAEALQALLEELERALSVSSGG